MRKDKRLTDVLQGKSDNYMLPFLWVRGEPHDLIIEEIDRIQQSGIGALCVESRPHEGFIGEQWWGDMACILSECQKRGMKVWVLDDKLYPSGRAADVLKDYPALRKRFIHCAYVDVPGPTAGGCVDVDSWVNMLVRRQTDVPPADNRLVAVLACERNVYEETLTGRVIDVTTNVSGGLCYLDLPEGVWRICIVFDSSVGAGRGKENYVDQLNPDSVQKYIDTVYESHYAHFADYFGNTFAGFFSDEPGFENGEGFYNTTMGVPSMPYPWRNDLLDSIGGATMLPALWFDMGDATAKVRIAYMDAITLAYKENFGDKIGRWCAKHNVEFIGHIIEDMNSHTRLGCSPGHFFRSLDGQHMAGIDVVLHQIVPGLTRHISSAIVGGNKVDPDFFHYVLAKLGASHAHIDPKKHGRAMCEIFGAYGWAEGTKMMKWLADHMLVRGINHYVPHAFSMRFPDPDCPPHFYAGGRNPQYAAFAELMRYMNRVCHLLNGGIHVVSAAILYHAEAEWSGGAYDMIQSPAKLLYDNQLDFDIVPVDYLEDVTIEDGGFSINGERYPCLVIPYAEVLPKRILSVARKLSQHGVPVIFTRGLPSRCSDGDVADYIMPNMRAVTLDALVETVAGIAADVTLCGKNPMLRVYHYRRGGNDYYMLTNEDIHNTASTTLTLSGFDGGSYAVYYPTTNSAVRYDSADGRIPVTLPPYNSLIIVTGALSESHIRDTRGAVLSREETLPFAFEVSTAVETEYPAFTPYTTLTAPCNLSAADKLPRFSGHFLYEGSFAVSGVDDCTRVLLDLGEVGEVASVWVNGIFAGTCIAPLYRFDVTDGIHDGDNALRIEVTNGLVYEQRDVFSRYLLWEPSGLLSPIKLQYYSRKADHV